jgi:hypothetical protein
MRRAADAGGDVDLNARMALIQVWVQITSAGLTASSLQRENKEPGRYVQSAGLLRGLSIIPAVRRRWRAAFVKIDYPRSVSTPRKNIIGSVLLSGAGHFDP